MNSLVQSKDEILKMISDFHLKLNREENLPEYSFRRNSVYYPLVCMVNNVIGAFLSKNYSTIPLFLRRIEKVKNDVNLKDEIYRELVDSYILLMALYIKEYTEIDLDHYIPELPEKLLNVTLDQIKVIGL